MIGNEFYDIQHYFGFSCMNTMTMFMHKRTDFFSLFLCLFIYTIALKQEARCGLRSNNSGCP